MIKTHASLFSGIGGAEIAAEWMGWDNLFHCEINPFGRKVLEYWYPNSESYEDITKTDFTGWRGKTGVLTGGFPCQPFSLAGARRGAEDDRYLWPQMLRAIREIQPSWVVGENVNGIVTMVQPGSEAEVGRTDDIFEADYIYRKEQEYVVETVCKDLERAGYAVQPFVIPACAVGAPHRRDRVWFIAERIAADTDGERCDNGRCNRQGRHVCSHCQRNAKESEQERAERQHRTCTDGADHGGPAPDTDGAGREEHDYPRESEEKTAASGRNRPYVPDWDKFPTQSPVCGGDDGLSLGLAGITFPKWRAEAVKALGNSFVPQVLYEIFKSIEEVERESNGTEEKTV